MSSYPRTQAGIIVVVACIGVAFLTFPKNRYLALAAGALGLFRLYVLLREWNLARTQKARKDEADGEE